MLKITKTPMSALFARILVVDAQRDSIPLLRPFLESHHLDVLEAHGGNDGLAKAVLGQPDLILLDVALPDMNGFTVCRSLKQDWRTYATPVIFLARRHSLEDKLAGFAAGGVDYITIPFALEEVLARIMVHVQARHRMRSLEAIAGLRALENAGASADPDELLFSKAVYLLEKRMATPLGLVELAHEIGTNERKLTQIFRNKAGTTVFDFFTELRLETARRLLEGSALQIQIIADRVGYRNAGDFTRAFRRHYGVTPREHRQALGVVPEESG